MEEYSILDLPEIREMILIHLESKERRKAVLVCPAFYKIICALAQDKLVLNNKAS